MYKTIFKNVFIAAVISSILIAALSIRVYRYEHGIIIAGVISLIGILICTAVTAFITTKKISDNLNKIDPENHDKNKIFNEFKPFLKRISDIHEEWEKMEKIRREFSANVSHELKTPLTSISGYAQMINNGMAKEEDICSFGMKIEKESERLILLINDIIRLSNLDESDGIPGAEKVDLYEEVQNVLLNISDVAKKRNIMIFTGGQSTYIQGNRTLIGELIYNLVDNAVKYNKDGGKITVTTGETAHGKVLSVSDTGIGIALDDQKRIFERFYRVDKSHSKTIGGTGLGLSIVKHIAICHNADIEVKSELDKGTEIMITFEKNHKMLANQTKKL